MKQPSKHNSKSIYSADVAGDYGCGLFKTEQVTKVSFMHIYIDIQEHKKFQK